MRRLLDWLRCRVLDDHRWSVRVSDGFRVASCQRCPTTHLIPPA